MRIARGCKWKRTWWCLLSSSPGKSEADQDEDLHW